MARYGSQEYPFTETMEPKPVDPYAISKVASEEVLKNLCNLNNIEWVIAVPHNIIGPKQRYNDPFRNVASIMINLILQNRQPLIYGDGNQKRCFSDIDDCIYCLDKLLMDPKIVGETINIGPDEEMTTINNIAKMVANETGYNGDPLYVLDRPQEVKFATCSAEKSRQLLNYKTQTKLKDAISKTCEFIKKYEVDPPKSGPWEGKPPISNYLGSCFLKIATHLSYKPNFVNYLSLIHI